MIFSRDQTKCCFAPLCFSLPRVHQVSQPGSKWSRIRRWRQALPYHSVWLSVWHRHIWIRRDYALLCCLDLYSSAKSVQNQPYHSLWLCRTDTYESGGPGTLPYRFVEIFRFKIKYSIIQVYFRQAHDTFSGTKTRLELCISQKICDLISTELPIVGKEVVSSNIPISCKRGMMQVMIFFGHFLELLHIYVLCTCSCHRTASCGPLLYTSLQMLSLSLFDRLL